MNEQLRGVEAEDLYRLRLVSDSQISPDGRNVVFCLQRVDKKSEKKFTNLWVVGADDGPVRQFTFGDQTDHHPRWSPDGRQVAFLSNRGDQEQHQIYLLPFDGGEARPLTDLAGEIATFSWSPDGRKVALQFRKKDQDAIERETDEAKQELGIIVRQIKRIHFKLDGSGYLPQERWHIWILDVESSQSRQLTRGIYDETGPVWSPDGRRIAFLSNRQPDPDLDPDAVGIYMVGAAERGDDTSEFKEIATPVGDKTLLSYSPDGRWLAYFGREGRGDWWKNDDIWLVPANGAAPARNLTSEYDLTAGNGTLGDFADRPTVASLWSADSHTLYFQQTRHGSTTLQQINLDGSPPTAVIDRPGVVGMFTADQSTSRIACCWGTMMEPGDIWIRDLKDEAMKRLTQMNEAVMSEIGLGHVDEIWIDGAEGNKLQGWIITPPDFDPNQRYPSILEIHGGPRMQYGNNFMHEFQYLAAQGYVIHCCNPRGSQGYGQEHSRAIQNDWGTVDYADLMAWSDFIEQLTYIDPDRMGVVGGSYGGFMTTWIIGHTHRFKAAVIQRAVSNLLSMWGSSDLNWLFQQEFGDEPPWNNLENLWRQSPIAFIGNATTPSLIMHSQNDMRCDPEQGLQIFVALKYLGVESELLLFPDESHGLSRGGRTDRRVARLGHILRWFDQYLKKESNGKS